MISIVLSVVIGCFAFFDCYWKSWLSWQGHDAFLTYFHLMQLQSMLFIVNKIFESHIKLSPNLYPGCRHVTDYLKKRKKWKLRFCGHLNVRIFFLRLLFKYPSSFKTSYDGYLRTECVHILWMTHTARRLHYHYLINKLPETLFYWSKGLDFRIQGFKGFISKPSNSDLESEGFETNYLKSESHI